MPAIAELEFRHTIVLPFVEGVHTALFAFLRTSETGEWLPDNEKHNDEFTLHFIRGNWKKSLLGSNRVPYESNVKANNKIIIKTQPMRLSVSMRPSPREIRISVCHAIYKLRIQRNHLLGEDDYKSKHAQWLLIIRTEVDEMCAYLHQYYDLKSPPKKIEQ